MPVASVRSFSAMVFALVAVPGLAVAIDMPVDLELVLAVDVSGSMDIEEQQVQRAGYMDAITHPQVLAAIREPVWGLAYLVMFAAGTIAGMLLVTVAIAAPLAAGTRRLPRLAFGVRVAAGALSLVFGLFLMNQVGVVDGLFSSAPAWQWPRRRRSRCSNAGRISTYAA